MESWHRVGQKVVCVDLKHYSFLVNEVSGLVERAIYTISDVDMGGFYLSEVRSKNGLPFNPIRFRPVKPTSIDAYREAWLNPAPEHRRALEDA